MQHYAKYGPVSPYTDKLSKDEILKLDAAALTTLLRELPRYQHDVFYAGSASTRKIAGIIKKFHPVASDLHHPLPTRKYTEKKALKDNVFFVDFPMVQVELLLLSKGTPKFNLQEFILSEWYNQYFGYGLSSIVFQEIRESKALAYSAYAYAANPAKKNRAHYLQAYVGTQPDKLRDAVQAFQTILEDMPVSIPQMEHARQSVLKQIAAGRINNAEIYWTWRANRDRGFQRDLREDIYRTMQDAKPDDLIRFHLEHIKGRKFNWMVLGDRNQIDFKFLKTLGKLKELSLEEIFGY